jgi:hypothetical protein
MSSPFEMLSKQQLIDLTGATRYRKQAQVLADNGIPYTLSANGEPRVLATEAVRRLLMQNAAKSNATTGG